MFHEESAVVLLVVMYGESDQGLQVLRSVADVSVCVRAYVRVCFQADLRCHPREHV